MRGIGVVAKSFVGVLLRLDYAFQYQSYVEFQ